MNVIKKILIAGLIMVIAYSAFSALQIENAYSSENAIHEEEMRYKPHVSEVWAGEDGAAEETFVNQEIVDLQAQYPDAVGWLTVPYTGIDYPFVQAEDNEKYLHKDLAGDSSFAGSIIMDCRNCRDFSDFNTIIYGHHMKNETMFGSLKKFNNKEFFNSNKNGTIFLADKTCELCFFEFFIISVDDEIVFSIPGSKDSALVFIEHVKENSRHYREIGVGPEDRIVTLCTCAYEFKNARMVLLGKISQTE